MALSPCFGPAKILLPGPGVPLETWACVAVDQFTSQPDYWQRAQECTAGVPSTLHIVLPEVWLGAADEAQRLAAIRAAMADYRQTVLTRAVNGYVYVERTLQSGRVRQGLVGAVDLEAYSYAPKARPAIRPSESTVVARIPPRLAVRRGAPLETPHVLMLADDPADALIGPVAAAKAALPKLYEGELMLGGGHIAGWAVEDPALQAGIAGAMAHLADPAAFAARWPAAPDPDRPMVLAVGDGNHSLATAKAYWEELKPTLREAERQTHPARYCLVEVCNVHSPAIEIEPIHRVLFGAGPDTVQKELTAWLTARGAALDPAGAQSVTLSGRDRAPQTLHITHAPEPLSVGTVERFVGDFLAAHPGVTVDYIHGAATAQKLAEEAETATALLLPELAKDDLFRGVVLGGVLPRKTFSMGHAEEKRYYNECRAILPA